MANMEKRKHLFDGSIFFYGLVVGLIAGTLGNLWASISYDLAKTDTNFDLVSAFWNTSFAFIAVLIAFVAVSIFLWRRSRKA